MKSLAIVILAAWLYAAALAPPPIWANDSKSVDPCACSQSASNGSADDSTDAASTAQASEPVSQSAARGGASGLFWKWFSMGERIQAGQPDWLSPLATTSGRLKQEYRYDLWQQPNLSGRSDYNFGGGKGLEFIVAPRLQLLVGPPPYVAHIGAATPDGFGDIPLMLKFRLAAAGPREGDYLVTLLLSATVPGGSSAMRDAVLSPGIAVGKGWGKIDLQSTLAANLPSADIATLGRQLVSNTAFQYRMPWRLWPEVEVNSTFFFTGKNAGETQVFLTPGIGFGRIHLWRAFRFSTAAGMQIAATHFHTYNRRAIVSIRYSF